MVLQGGSLDKTLPADSALVWPLACVPADVESQVVGLREALLAIGALVGPLSTVDSHVLLQFVGASKSLLAYGAHMWTFAGVRPTMALEVRGSGEGHCAIIAFERLLPGMATHMDDQVGGGADRLATKGTQKPFWFLRRCGSIRDLYFVRILSFRSMELLQVRCKSILAVVLPCTKTTLEYLVLGFWFITRRLLRFIKLLILYLFMVQLHMMQ